MSNWCASWSSKPVWGVKSVLGGFDSHMPSPENSPDIRVYRHPPAAAGGDAIIDIINKQTLLWITMGRKNGFAGRMFHPA